MSERPFQRRGPSGPLAVPAPSGLVQAGFDQPDSLAAYAASATFATTLFRDTAQTQTLQVKLPGVTPGNILVVDFSGETGHIPDVISSQTFLPVVSFNGNPVYAPGNGFFQINNALSSGWRASVGAGIIPGTIRCHAAVVIPDGATDAIVQVSYVASGAFTVPSRGEFPQLPSVVLEAMELLRGAVPQPGPFTLVSF